jgi:hypothetical protein
MNMHKPVMTIALITLLTASGALYAAEATTTAPATQPVRLLAPDQTQNEIRAHLIPLIPKFKLPTDPDAWMKEADALRKRVLEEVVFRGVPESWQKSPTKAVWGETIQGKGYKIRKLRYEIVPGFWTGALLYEPDTLKGKVPAILNVNGHVGAEGMTIPYEQIRRINLAKRGMLALGLEWTGMGQLSTPGHDHKGANFLELCGIAGVSVHYMALKRGLDILLEHKNADPERVAMTGLSGGGWQTIFFSSLDTRIKLAAPNAGYNGNLMRAKALNDLGDEEQSPVDLGTVCDYVHLTAMLAPRYALIIANTKDTCCFRADRAKESVVDPVKPVYELFDKSDNFDFHANEDPGTHNYDKDNREAFYKFVNKHFLPKGEGKDEEIPVDDEVRKQADLAIDLPKENGSFFTLAAEAMKKLPVSTRPSYSDRAVLDEWRKKTRDELRKVIRLSSDADPKVEGVPADAKVPAPKEIETHSWLLKIGDTWTIPVVEYLVAGSQPSLSKLIVCDKGRAAVKDLIDEALKQEYRVFVADILLTGECCSQHENGYAWLWSLLTSEHGERPLGLQVSQLHALAGWIKNKYPQQALHLVTRHRISGVAALTYAALYPSEVALVKAIDVESSLKNLLEKQIVTLESQSVFCTGLLKVADISDLIDMANPTRAELADH